MRLADVPTGALVQVRIEGDGRSGRGFGIVREDRVVFVAANESGWVEGMSHPRPLRPTQPVANLTAIVLRTDLDANIAVPDLELIASHAVLCRTIKPERIGDEKPSPQDVVRFKVCGTLLDVAAEFGEHNDWQRTVDDLVAWLIGQGLGATSHELHVLTAFASAGRTVAEPGRFAFWQGVPPGALVRHRDHRYFRFPNVEGSGSHGTTARADSTHGCQVCFDGAWLDKGADPGARPWDGFGLLGETVEIIAVSPATGSAPDQGDFDVTRLQSLDRRHSIRTRLARLRAEWPVFAGADVEALVGKLDVDTSVHVRDVRPGLLAAYLNGWGDGQHLDVSEQAALRFDAQQLHDAADELLREMGGRADDDPVIGLRHLLAQIREHAQE